MPRLTLDLPDDLRRPDGRRENGERTGEDATVQGDSRERTTTPVDSGRIDDPQVARWHRCWARGDQ